jgi:hypothetical protein
MDKLNRLEEWKLLIEQYKDSNPLLSYFYSGRAMEAERMFKLLTPDKKEIESD